MGVYPNPLFGWAELENVGGTIQLLNGALVVPRREGFLPVRKQLFLEPTTFALLFLSSTVLFVARRRRLWGVKHRERAQSLNYDIGGLIVWRRVIPS